MREPFLDDVFGNARGDIGVLLDLRPSIIKFIVISSANPILNQFPQLEKFICIEMGPDGPEHMPPAIEYARAFRECQVNCIDLHVIAICHKNRWGNLRALCLDQAQKKLYCRLRAIGRQHPGNGYTFTNELNYF